MANNLTRQWMGLGALILSSVAWAGGRIDEVEARPTETGVIVEVVGRNLSQPKVIKSATSTTFTFEASLSGKSRKTTVGANGVGEVRTTVVSTKPARVSVVVSTTDQNPTITKSEFGFTISYGAKAAPKPSSFPTAVPPIEPQPKMISALTTNPLITAIIAEPKVSLDFVGTDVVLILKSLALQSGVNIVTSPEVTGKISISLNTVTLPDAMDFVTTMAGLRYTKVNGTYVVATPAKFADMLSQINGRQDLATETRVIPIHSHQGLQVKAAVLKAVPVVTALGKYDLLLSSEEISIQQTQTPTPQAAGDPKQGGAQQQPDTTVQTKTNDKDTANKDSYVVVIGTPSRIAEVERAIRAIDTRICEATGIKVPESNGSITRSYEPKGILAEDLLDTLRNAKGIDLSAVKIVATPRTSSSRQAIVVNGRSSDVDSVLDLLAGMDSLNDGGPVAYEVIDLRFIRPNHALIQLQDAVPGLKVKLLPAPINPMMGISVSEFAATGRGQMGANGQNGGQAGGQQQGGGAQGGGAQGGGQAGGQGTQGPNGNPIPVQNSENLMDGMANINSGSFAMKLLVRGSKDQIDKAREYLRLVDIAPRQVAIELRVMELSREEALKIGLDLTGATKGTLSTIRLNNGLGTDSTLGGSSAALKFPGGGTLGALGLLDQITTRNNLITRPNTIAQDGVLTNIFVGDEVRYVESISQSANNGLQVVTNKVDVGVDFWVCPRVGSDGTITLQMNPMLSLLQGFTSVPGGGQLPQTSKRSANMQFHLQSGETIAIGGLIQEQDRRSYGGIPILKDLPLIGRLFGRTTNSKAKSEVVFFITAREITQDDRGPSGNPINSEKKNDKWPGGGPDHYKNDKKGGGGK
jgi:type II secretory pathway component GspD/PulD (secretin)